MLQDNLINAGLFIHNARYIQQLNLENCKNNKNISSLDSDQIYYMNDTDANPKQA